jgi:hypothetical protein
VGIHCQSAHLPSARCQDAASPANVPVAKPQGCQTSLENTYKMKKQSHLYQPNHSPEPGSTSSKLPACARLSSYKLPSACCQDARCQVPVPSVPSLELPGDKNSRLKSVFKVSSSDASNSLSFSSFPPSPSTPTDMFWAFWVFELSFTA